MKRLTETLAAARYDSFWDELMSRRSLDVLACFGSISAFVCVVFLARRHFSRKGSYWSGLFLLCLFPLVLCTANALTDLPYGYQAKWTRSYVVAYLTHDIEVHFGWVVSGMAILIYSLFHALSRNIRTACTPRSIRRLLPLQPNTCGFIGARRIAVTGLGLFFIVLCGRIAWMAAHIHGVFSVTVGVVGVLLLMLVGGSIGVIFLFSGVRNKPLPKWLTEMDSTTHPK